MSNKELDNYITTLREKNVPDQQIKDTLVKTGWAAEQVDKALTPKETSTETLPPPPAPRFGMWLAFHYIILFISLYVVALALGQTLHYIVNESIPDALDAASYSSYYMGTIVRWYLAALLVVFPVFAFLFLLAKRQILKNPGIRNFQVRKVLIYITLVITFIIMIWKLVQTVYGFLGGEISTRFVLHFLITFVISASIFFYLLNEVREDRKLT